MKLSFILFVPWQVKFFDQFRVQAKRWTTVSWKGSCCRCGDRFGSRFVVQFIGPISGVVPRWLLISCLHTQKSRWAAQVTHTRLTLSGLFLPPFLRVLDCAKINQTRRKTHCLLMTGASCCIWSSLSWLLRKFTLFLRTWKTHFRRSYWSRWFVRFFRHAKTWGSQ